MAAEATGLILAARAPLRCESLEPGNINQYRRQQLAQPRVAAHALVMMQMAAQEQKLRQLADQEQLLAASIAQVIGAADPAVSEAQLGLQRVSPSSFSQLVSEIRHCWGPALWLGCCQPYLRLVSTLHGMLACQDAALNIMHLQPAVQTRTLVQQHAQAAATMKLLLHLHVE